MINVMTSANGADLLSGVDSPEHRMCDRALSRAFDLLGKRWNGVILATLRGTPAGFSELRRAVGSITDSVLSDRLTELAEAGLVSRKVTDTRPPGVTYELTCTGQALMPVLDKLAAWAGENLPEHRCASASRRRPASPDDDAES
jgi:DNA-binding HxlR family transcriptional regulator